MNIIDKGNFLKKIEELNYVSIEVGCGNFKRNQKSISIDVVNLESVDIVANLEEGLLFLKDNSVDEISSFHFLEHLSNLELFFMESFRVLKKGGVMKGVVPYFSHPFFYGDYTHKNFFSLYTFEYLSKEKYFSRDIPKFYNNIDFKIIELKLDFISTTRKMRILKKIIQKYVNKNKKNMEFYEENFSNIIPAFSIHFELKKI